MQKCLALFSSARQVSTSTMCSDLRHMPNHCTPALYLALVFFRNSSAPIIPAIPLKPSARIVFVYPPFFSPHRKRLACIHSEKIEFGVVSGWVKESVCKPCSREFFCAVGHVFSSKNTERKQFFRRKVRLKQGAEVLPFWFCTFVYIPALHTVVDGNIFFHI